ncbi:acylphosphatase [Lentimicrobium sp.]|jgi:acylphosphatase|uniref:acylphosphatase n=1 Tax=Lentimicrobium sp. TaxID=2034841 RepID=UPI002BBCA37E|nr:acylphosphatase [Lentimicrobium sp.]MCO5262320.1 acylphosphatase [Lentimicrobium sp.]HRW69647.1 acylphosphatase [Lentimicrobium sp.]
MEKRFQIYISGNVQRVGFRHQASQQAKLYNIKGKAMYIDSGLLIEAEGDSEQLGFFVDWCRTGPGGCSIESFEVREMPPFHYSGFEIIHGVISSDSPVDSMIRS